MKPVLTLSALAAAALVTLAATPDAHARHRSDLRVQVVLGGGGSGIALDYGPPPPPPVVVVQQPAPPVVYAPPAPVYYPPQPVYDTYYAPQPEVVYVPGPTVVKERVVVVDRGHRKVEHRASHRGNQRVYRDHRRGGQRTQVVHRTRYNVRGGGR